MNYTSDNYILCFYAISSFKDLNNSNQEGINQQQSYLIWMISKQTYLREQQKSHSTSYFQQPEINKMKQNKSRWLMGCQTMRTSYRQTVDTVIPYRHYWWCWGLGLSRWRTRGGRQYCPQGGTDGVLHPRRHRRAVTFYRVNEVSYKVSIWKNRNCRKSSISSGRSSIDWLTTALSLLFFVTCNNVQNRIYPFVTSLTPSHPARDSAHLPNFKHTHMRKSVTITTLFLHTRRIKE